MNELISVIVPVYNTERYLPKCIESIINQTYKNLEIILVDDGSPDKCPEICDRYAAKDKRIRVIHKENGGVSSARNYGINAAKGDVITFVDSDDYVEPFFAGLLSRDIKDDTDVAFYSMIQQSESGIKIGGHKYHKDTYIPNCELGNYLDRINAATPVGIGFKRQVIEKNNLRFQQNFSMGEDSLFSQYYLFLMNKGAYLSSRVVYHYVRWNLDSLANCYHENIEEVYKAISKIQQELNQKYGADIYVPTEKLVATMAIQNLYANQCPLNRQERIERIRRYMDDETTQKAFLMDRCRNRYDWIRKQLMAARSPGLLDFVYTLGKIKRDFSRK